MTPDVFADWLRRQGHRVVRTKSSYWFDQGPRVFQAFPYHWVIEPEEEELLSFLEAENAIGLRYSTPLGAAEGSCSYHVVYDRPTYEFKEVDPSIRSKVRRGLEACQVGPIAFERYAKEGWLIEQDTQNRQHRHSRRGRSRWERMVGAAEGLEGFEVWGAEVDGRLAATLMFAQVEGCVDLLYQQSLREFLPFRVNNALLFETTRSLVARPSVHTIHNGLHSLDAPASVDQFKLRLGYTLRPLRQRIVFHPRLAPFFGRDTSRLLSRFANVLPEQEVIQKAEGLTRFYLNGKLPLARQAFPELLEPIRDELCQGIPTSGWSCAEHRLKDGRVVRITPSHLADLEPLVALHLACFTQKEHPAIGLGPAFIRDAYRWFLTSPDTLALVARLDGQVVGYTTISNRPYSVPLLRACTWTVLRGLIRRPWLAFRSEWIARVLPPVRSGQRGGSPPMAQIAFTGITAELRGEGIGRALKEASIQACRAWGVPSVCTGVRRENRRARALNERFGFRERPDLSTREHICLSLQLDGPPAPSPEQGRTGAPAGPAGQPHEHPPFANSGSLASAIHPAPDYRLANSADIPEIVRVHQAAFPGFFMTLLGPRSLRTYYLRVLEYSDHVFWVKAGETGLEGFACGFLNPVEFYRQMKDRRFRFFLPIFHRVLFRPWTIHRLLASYSQVLRSIHEEEPDTCELSSIAVDPRHAGKGVGQGLAKAFIDSVTGRATAIVLTTDALGNDGVNHFYQKLGFSLDGAYERSKGRLLNKYRLDLA